MNIRVPADVHTYTHVHIVNRTLIYIILSALIYVKLMLSGGQVIENFTITGFILMLIRM